MSGIVITRIDCSKVRLTLLPTVKMTDIRSVSVFCDLDKIWVSLYVYYIIYEHSNGFKDEVHC